MNSITITYNDRVSRQFIAASVVFGLVGMLVGAIIAAQLYFQSWNFNISYFGFGRLRPLHTNAVIFAFVGNMIFAGIYYSSQRLLKTRIASDFLASLHFWGWQAIIVAAAITLPLGITQGKEYAELEWPIDLAIAVVWVVFAINFFWTLAIRREKNLYVAIWFYIATIVTVAVLHIVNNLSLPISLTKSYSIYSGVQDALVQWWYGHNAVAFFLTTPVLGIMYYFLPKAADRPVYSYRLSLVHFWSLVFVYIWAGPHHLLYTALPDWAQSLGMVFSLMLWAPSWGGMLNGLLTMKGAWHKLKEDPVLKFFIAGVTFYGMATFEGPLLSIKSVNALAHYTDWIVGHVHSGALGWNGFMAAGMFYWMVPRLYGTKLHSRSMADVHFWLGTFGIILYVCAMWASGITQGLMLKATNPDGSLMHANFLETLDAIKIFYIMRLIGGIFYIVGYLLMIYNLLATAKSGHAVDGQATVVEKPREQDAVSFTAIIFSRPIALVSIILVFVILAGVTSLFVSVLFLTLALVVAVFAYITAPVEGNYQWHRILEGRAFIFTGLTLLAILIGGIAELLPALLIKNAVPFGQAKQAPYSPLQLAGRDIYVREGCYNCHSQMVRTLIEDTTRYGKASQPEEFIYDRPFQWGSKRTGPDLHRVGGKWPNSWHYQHLLDPKSTSLGSNMPSYAFLKDQKIDFNKTTTVMQAMKTLGVPYKDSDILNGPQIARREADAIALDLRSKFEGINIDSEVVALIAYLQALGKTPVP